MLEQLLTNVFKVDKLLSRKIKEYVMVTIGALLVSIAINFMLKPNTFINGGLTGLVILLEALFNTSKYISFNTLYFGINIILLALGYKVLGSKEFVIKTIYASLLISGFNYIIDFLIKSNATIASFVVHDVLLVTVYSSLLLGAGVGTVIRNGGSTGGLDIPQKILNVSFKIPFSWCLLMIDGSIIVLGFVSFGIERGMYWLASIYIIGKVIDAVSIGFSNATATYIVTNRKEAITRLIYQSIDRGVTIVPCIGGYSNEHKDMLCVVCSSRREYNELREIITLYDPECFIFATRATDIEGLGFGKKKYTAKEKR